MRIRLIAIGQKMPEWVTAGFGEYVKRLPADCSLDLIEIPLAKRGKNVDVARAMKREGEQMLAAIGAHDTVITLEVKGSTWSTEQLSTRLASWRDQGQSISLLVGGPEGLDDACLAKADVRWSLSPLTLPHPLVRIVLAEQLYRAWTILQNHPYHRG
jgi:23S rRNA (pseudouridine1915-N3)-methyltransferase